MYVLVIGSTHVCLIGHVFRACLHEGRVTLVEGLP